MAKWHYYNDPDKLGNDPDRIYDGWDGKMYDGSDDDDMGKGVGDRGPIIRGVGDRGRIGNAKIMRMSKNMDYTKSDQNSPGTSERLPTVCPPGYHRWCYADKRDKSNYNYY